MNRLFLAMAFMLLAVALTAGCAGQAKNDDTVPDPVSDDEPRPFAITVTDRATKRAIPMVEIRTQNHRSYFTDNSGKVAIDEPGYLDDLDMFFHFFSPGYEFTEGFGDFRGVSIRTQPGGVSVQDMKRIQPAERLYRLTGQGRHRHSLLLGEDVALDQLAETLVGHRQASAIPFNGKTFWFWSGAQDAQNSFPGHMIAGAVSSLFHGQEEQWDEGLYLKHMTDGRGRLANLAPDPASLLPEGSRTDEVFLQLGGLMAVADEDGKEWLLVGYEIRETAGFGEDGQTSGEMLGIGILRFDEQANRFEPFARFPLDSKRVAERLYPHGSAVYLEEDGQAYWIFGSPYPVARVPATWEAIQDPARYETWMGTEVFARLQDADSGETVELVTGSIAWQANRGRWILLGERELPGRPKQYELWYAESTALAGPWDRAKRIAQQTGYAFGQPLYFGSYAQEGREYIYFGAGYYLREPSKKPVPGFGNNLFMYRLDLALANPD